MKGYDLRVKGYDLRVKGYDLRVKGYDLRVKGYDLRVKGYDLKGEKDTAKEQRIPPRHGTLAKRYHLGMVHLAKRYHLGMVHLAKRYHLKEKCTMVSMVHFIKGTKVKQQRYQASWYLWIE